MRSPYCVCDRCYQLINGGPIVVHCLSHKLREASPMSCLELCAECASELVAWVKAGPEPVKMLTGPGDEPGR